MTFIALLTVSPVALIPASTSYAANAQAKSKCKIVVHSAHWSIRERGGRISGNKYTLSAQDFSCYQAYFYVDKFAHEKIKGAGRQGLGQILKGPRGFKCRSLAEQASGDKLVYSGYCLGPGTNHVASFAWAPKP
ncbi:MAG: hypothetical protein ACRDNK_06705 [Solirubrobacteraceae bacterium]